MSTSWTGKRVVIVGAARQGLALARYLTRHGAKVVLNDAGSETQMREARDSLAGISVEWSLGGHPLTLLNGADVVSVSGGVPLQLPMLAEAQRKGIPLTNDTQIFMESVPCKVIGITGSAGKTTTTTLVGRMATAGMNPSTRVWVGGNIGQPLIDHVDEMQPGDLVVMETSSFQLELMTHSPQIGAILNITPNHLDRHGSMAEYTAAKTRLLDFQNSEDTVVLGREDPGAWSLVDRVKGRLITFGMHEPTNHLTGTFLKDGWLRIQDQGSSLGLMPRDVIQLRGEHNLLNVLAACAISFAAGLPVRCMQEGVEGFTGVAHRLQFVRTWRGSDWYNDSIATAPERSIAGMRAFDEPLVLLAGGRDKKLPWEAFADVVHRRVDHLIVFGEASDIILKAVGPVHSGKRPYTIAVCKSLQAAVETAAAVVEPGDVVLLSPGGTSFDEFNDFEERGERYIQWVMALS
ncbi:MAG: UDP-N-acetylmuramoyl-L-alanine--D-glutamate ligase [Anaerolineaceae bacterium]|nr:UDP-N-acetylmuramoyl-L-alanine--D-glutamate ligase [Anaerolineaceae bacterium]